MVLNGSLRFKKFKNNQKLPFIDQVICFTTTNAVINSAILKLAAHTDLVLPDAKNNRLLYRGIVV